MLVPFTIASWWLRREIEAAALTCRDLVMDTGRLLATLNLAASKMDIAAKGAFHTHGCSCVAEEGSIDQ
eukprot:668274-Amphidinium_carterae.1